MIETRTRIKVCGMTNQAEAEAIVALGVDALGFIFVRSSPRFIEAEKVRKIADCLPPFVNLVGVFMNEAAALVNDIARSCGLTMVQLHGDESPDYCRAMIRPVLKAFRVREEALPDFEPYRGAVKGFLLDTYRTGQAGGTGETFNWDVVNHLTLPGPLVLAGGLTPDNVGAAIRQTRPLAVDVNSGVETSPGKKDLTLVRRLFAEVRTADSDRASHPVEGA
jgi:phosphoribosylanthranilate isomerase